MVAVIQAARKEIDRSERSSEVALTLRLGLAASSPLLLTIDEGLAAADAAVDAGIDFLDISHAGGVDDELGTEIRGRAEEVLSRSTKQLAQGTLEGFTPTFLLAALAKERVAVPVIGVNGITTPQEAETALEIGIADMVAVGRGVLADPEWAKKTLGEIERPIELCRKCKPRCFWFKEAPKCPARKRLAKRGEQPEVA